MALIQTPPDTLDSPEGRQGLVDPCAMRNPGLVSSDVLAAQLSREISSSLGQEAKRGLVWTTLQSLINRFSGFVVFLVLARLLEPRAFGIFAAAVAFVTLTTLVAEAGLSRALIQRPVLTGAHLDTSLVLTTILGLG